MNKLAGYFIVCLFLFGWTLHSSAQVGRARVVVAYINNFALYTTWPGEHELDTFRIELLSGNGDIIQEMRAFVDTRQIKGKPVALTTHRSIPLSTRAQIFLITQDQSNHLDAVYDLIGNKPVLLVSENYPDRRAVMINLFENESNELLFEVNEANMINQHLEIEPEILAAGGNTLDLARLYRESQQSLRSMKADMDRMADSLNILYQDAMLKMDEVQLLTREINRQQLLLNARNEEINNYEGIIRSQRHLLEVQRDSILLTGRILNEQEDRVVQQLSDYDQLRNDMLQLENDLQQRQKLYEELDREISRKNQELGAQSEIIVRQRYLLLLIATVGLLTLVLILSTYTAYRRNKRINKLLNEQKLQIIEKLQQLEELNVRLQNADHYKSVFLASMSHELRTPLNSIIGYTGILLMGLAGDLNEEQKLQLTKVKNNGNHLLSLINDVLDISKIEADRVELHCETFHLSELIKEILDTMFPKAAEKSLTLESFVDHDLILHTDRRRLKQVILNLVSNAVNYTESGSVRLEACIEGEDKLRLSVTDTGIGIPEKSLTRLFQPFQQIESNLTKKNKGTGLGLYLCRKLMKLMQGDIFVRSEYGKGSEFFIVMPLNTEKTEMHEENSDHRRQ